MRRIQVAHSPLSLAFLALCAVYLLQLHTYIFIYISLLPPPPPPTFSLSLCIYIYHYIQTCILSIAYLIKRHKRRLSATSPGSVQLDNPTEWVLVQFGLVCFRCGRLRPRGAMGQCTQLDIHYKNGNTRTVTEDKWTCTCTCGSLALPLSSYSILLYMCIYVYTYYIGFQPSQCVCVWFLFSRLPYLSI